MVNCELSSLEAITIEVTTDKADIVSSVIHLEFISADKIGINWSITDAISNVNPL